MTDNQEIYERLLNLTTTESAKIITAIYDYLDMAGIKDYLQPTSEVLDVDEIDLDPAYVFDSLKNIAMKYGIGYIKRMGIFIELDDTVSPRDILNIMIALDRLKAISEPDALFINAVVTDEETDPLNKLAAILIYLNPDIEREKILRIVDDIADRFFIVLENITKKITDDSDLVVTTGEDKNTELVNALVLLNEYFIDRGFKSMPDLLVKTALNPMVLEAVVYNPEPTYKATRLALKNILEPINEDILEDVLPYSILDFYLARLLGGKHLKEIREDITHIFETLPPEIFTRANEIYNKLLPIVENDDLLRLVDKIRELVKRDTGDKK